MLEEVGTENIAQGMALGQYNARGVHWVDPSGAEDRALASRHREWSKKLAFDTPFTAKVLEDLAKRYDHDAERHIEDHRLERRVDR
jgi:hypothetical protein